ncbi:MAG TPA: hypothetical protein VE987_22475 [Polyangiaceae bacterium]|nr:hypothetical protein [Polyangiaceae bacterium]
MATKSPLSLVKETFGDKSKLVEAVQKLSGDDLWVARTNESKGLARVSNAKLLRLHATFTEVKEKFGTREKLIDAVLELQKRTGDAGLRQRLSAWPVPRLYDVYRSTAKRLRSKTEAQPKAEARVDRAATTKAATKSAPKKAAAAKKSAAKTAKKPAKKAAAGKAGGKGGRG